MRILILFMALSLHFSALAKPEKSKLKVEHDFRALQLKGLHKSPMGASVISEKSKVVYEILSVRKHFKDRVRLELKETR